MKNVLSRLKGRSLNKLLRAAVIAALAVIFFSCAAIPEKAEMWSGAELLPEAVNIVISTRVEGNLELIQPVLEVMADSIPSEMSEDFLERTSVIWAGLELIDGSDGKFRNSIAAEGDYPKGLIEWGLCWNADWKKEKFNPIPGGNFEMVYWDDEKSGNQIALPASDYMLASSGAMEEMLTSWAGGAVPSGREWIDAEAASDVTIMTKGLSQEEYSRFVPELKKVPIESLILFMKRSGDDYLISGTFHMDSPGNAFLFAAIFRTLIVTAKTPEGKRQFTNLKEIKIEKNNNDVVLEGMRLPAETVAAIEREWLILAGVNLGTKL
ncbi:MAG: hypothetical protein JEZ04_04700 [Spirochaetales bacterium]|nr:hypothetical protein [Spirochaetales bacterium]